MLQKLVLMVSKSVDQGKQATLLACLLRYFEMKMAFLLTICAVLAWYAKASLACCSSKGDLHSRNLFSFIIKNSSLS